MMSIFQVFKIIFGIVASVMILYFMMTYATGYGSTQEATQRMLVMKNFRQMADDVIITGVAEDFSLERVKDVHFDVRFSPVLSFGDSTLEVTSPLFFRNGSKVAITRGEMDLGWWKFDYAMATPEMTVIFNPLENNDDVWNLMKNITDALPDTSSTEIKFSYSFCGYPGASSFSQKYDRFSFQSLLGFRYDPTKTFQRCTASLPLNSILITISASCNSKPLTGICANPNGRFYIDGSTSGYYYIDGLDIAAAAIGGTETTIRGLEGENVYNYKKTLYGRSMRLAAEVTGRRALILSEKMAALVSSGAIESGSEPAMCATYYVALADALRTVSNEMTNPDYYISTALKPALARASSAYNSLAARGCEVLE